jgi:type I restriction enzyme R subunit
MAKFDAADRQATGEPVPEEIQRLLGNLIASATSSGEVLDIYEAAGMPKPSLDDLTPEFIAKTQQARNPQLAIEALRKLIADESAKTTRNNVIRQRAFSERITELMRKYTNQQLTSAEVIAELVELAREVAAEGNRGAQFTPPLNSDELAFYDAVAQNESAVEAQGAGVLADIARELVSVMRRDVRTDWTVRDDVGPSCAPRSNDSWFASAIRRTSSPRRSSWSWNKWNPWPRGLPWHAFESQTRSIFSLTADAPPDRVESLRRV